MGEGPNKILAFTASCSEFGESFGHSPCSGEFSVAYYLHAKRTFGELAELFVELSEFGNLASLSSQTVLSNNGIAPTSLVRHRVYERGRVPVTGPLVPQMRSAGTSKNIGLGPKGLLQRG